MKDSSGMHKIKTEEFKKVLEELGLSEESLSNRIAVQTLSKRWADIIGPIYANQSEPYSIQGDVLIIVTSHTAYKQEILFLKKRILSYSARYLGKDTVRKVEVRIGNLSRKQQKQAYQPVDKTGLDGKQDLISLLEKETDPIAKKRLLELIEYL
ncbi:DUF721 domain-containing protein [Leptospira langatensis]|uniref:DUF721 domain-containing protein n=1 Tax=Leptospira langatensis TaxID=2484983 RepID=A0A5F1ZUH1_9LEPT|nr:DUF721 domain-containing protein [Leptospira langatensis]TGK03149.1 DUF721 domain-containing protein [Leptospira langatensis]TGL41906.1 DUF721 domain-containing protein [Leptospira langatensis]